MAKYTESGGDDLFIGTTGDDTFTVGKGKDQVGGQQGHDTLMIDYSAPGTTGSSNSTIYSNAASYDGAIQSGANSVSFTSIEAVTLLYGAGNDTLAISGSLGSGDKQIHVNAGAGVDTLQVRSATDTSFLVAADNSVTVGTSDYTHFERFQVTLGDGNDVVRTGSLGDIITTGSGNDIIDGGGGYDTMTGGAGDDTYYVDSTGEKVIEAQNGGNDTIYTSTAYTLAGTFVETLRLTGTGNYGIDGNDQDNALFGNTADNALHGGGGADYMVGGAGNDIYYVDDSRDTALEFANGGNDVVFATASYSLVGTFVETLVLSGLGDLDATGNNQRNTLGGNDGDNVFTTGLAADVVDLNWHFGHDRITDFTPGTSGVHDTVFFIDTVLSDYSDVMAHSQQVGSDVVVTAGPDDVLTIENVALASLTASDFMFA